MLQWVVKESESKRGTTESASSLVELCSAEASPPSLPTKPQAPLPPVTLLAWVFSGLGGDRESKETKEDFMGVLRSQGDGTTALTEGAEVPHAQHPPCHTTAQSGPMKCPQELFISINVTKS